VGVLITLRRRYENIVMLGKVLWVQSLTGAAETTAARAIRTAVIEAFILSRTR
jgi:hypothetical protein